MTGELGAWWQCGFADAAREVEANGIDGKTFLSLSLGDLMRPISLGGLGQPLSSANFIRQSDGIIPGVRVEVLILNPNLKP
jgi:hypothetical protein